MGLLDMFFSCGMDMGLSGLAMCLWVLKQQWIIQLQKETSADISYTMHSNLQQTDERTVPTT
eukprot:1230503-Pyramimonas_sp.AAC.1